MGLGVIRPVRQHLPHTCAIAALSIVIERDYQDVYDRALADYTWITAGLTTAQILRLARVFQCPLRLHRGPVEFDEHEGMVDVEARAPKLCHAVVLFNGSIYDPMDGCFYEPGTYLATYPVSRKARWGRLLVRVRDL